MLDLPKERWPVLGVVVASNGGYSTHILLHYLTVALEVERLHQALPNQRLVPRVKDYIFEALN
jgi:hypothetical protein